MVSADLTLPRVEGCVVRTSPEGRSLVCWFPVDTELLAAVRVPPPGLGTERLPQEVESVRRQLESRPRATHGPQRQQAGPGGHLDGQGDTVSLGWVIC